MLKRLGLALLSTLLVLAALELWARRDLGPGFRQGVWVGPPQAVCGRFDPELGWANREGSVERIALGPDEYTVTINARGLRGPERDYAKPPGVVRVLLLGDSTGWGWGVDDDEAFAGLVEAELAELDAGVEVINLSVPGYSTDQQLLALEREGLRYAPDLVLLGLVHNDLVGNRFPEFHDMPKPLFEVAAQASEAGADGLVLTNVPIELPGEEHRLAARYRLRRWSTRLALVKRLLPPPPRYVRQELERDEVRAAIDRYWDHLADPASLSSRLIARLAARCAENGAPLHAFVLPHLHDRYLYDPEVPVPAEVAELPAGETVLTRGSRRLRELGERLGFATFSVDRALLSATSTGVSLDCGDEHLNAEGNRILAREIAAHLRAALGE